MTWNACAVVPPIAGPVAGGSPWQLVQVAPLDVHARLWAADPVGQAVPAPWQYTEHVPPFPA